MVIFYRREGCHKIAAEIYAFYMFINHQKQKTIRWVLKLVDNIGGMKWIPYKKKKCSRIPYLENNMTEGIQLQLIKLQIGNDSKKIIKEQV